VRSSQLYAGQVDHTGVPNSQLVKERAAIAQAYNGKCIAEQNSIDLAWGIFMDPAYSDLRSCICVDQSELSLFRQLVVNTVLATDIFDQELRAIRTNSWNKVFGGASHDDSPQDFTNRRATVVIQHIVMAADVAHTMQDVSALLPASTRP
jgi:3'5'-cyclic nucleotide phosphodiesterase